MKLNRIENNYPYITASKNFVVELFDARRGRFNEEVCLLMWIFTIVCEA